MPKDNYSIAYRHADLVTLIFEYTYAGESETMDEDELLQNDLEITRIGPGPTILYKCPLIAKARKH